MPWFFFSSMGKIINIKRAFVWTITVGCQKIWFSFVKISNGQLIWNCKFDNPVGSAIIFLPDPQHWLLVKNMQSLEEKCVIFFLKKSDGTRLYLSTVKFCGWLIELTWRLLWLVVDWLNLLDDCCGLWLTYLLNWLDNFCGRWWVRILPAAVLLSSFLLNLLWNNLDCPKSGPVEDLQLC